MGTGNDDYAFDEESLDKLVELCRKQGTMQFQKGTDDYAMASHLMYQGLLKAAGQSPTRAYYTAPAKGRRVERQEYNVTRAYHAKDS